MGRLHSFMKIIVTSKNPIKKQATLLGFKAIFPTETFEIVEISVPSDVSNQPMSETETLRGAKHRVNNAIKLIPDADYWIGLEGGVEIKNNEMESFAWIYISDKKGKIGKGRTGTFFLPKKISTLVKQGKELGEADDIVFKLHNSKQKMGTIGILSRNAVDRTEYYKQAVIFALLPFVNPDLYSFE